MARLVLLIALLGGWLARASADPIPVTVQPLQALVVHPRFDAPANVVSLNESRIGVEIDGRIETIPMRVGERVERDTVLARIACTDFEIAARRQQAALAALGASQRLAQQQLERAEKLVKQRSASEELVDQRRAEVARLDAEIQGQQAALESAQRDVAHCDIRAPFRGIVLARLVNVGEMVATGAPIITLVDTQDVEVSARARLADVAGLEGATDIVFADDARRYPVRIRALVPVVKPDARSREVRLVFEGEPALIGSTGRLEWRLARPYLPADLLVRREQTLGIFTVVEDVARFRALPGALEGRPAAVDLPVDTAIVVEGRQGLSDGEAVRLVTPSASPAP
jgi:RND family efflux transporter MFP subunit